MTDIDPAEPVGRPSRVDGPPVQLAVELAAEVVAVYVTNNKLPTGNLPDLITAVYGAFAGLGIPSQVEEQQPIQKPAVAIRKSVTDEYIISLEDGRRMMSLKRHLAALGMTPDQYRAKWGLPRDYPMVAPASSARRSALAKRIGLGSMHRRSPDSSGEA